MAYRVGFASLGGYQVDQHFGAARIWQIYDIDDVEETFLGTRKTDARCAGNCEGGFDHILETLHDCDALFVSRIGPSAAAYMISHGKRVFEAAGKVDDLIVALIEGDWLKEEG